MMPRSSIVGKLTVTRASGWGRHPFCLAAVHRQRDPKRRAVQTTIHYDSAWRDGP